MNDSLASIVGRKRELDAISGVLEKDANGPSFLVVEGDAGIGKSALWREGLRLVEDSHIVLQCRPVQAE